jgi:hypothetical protein
LLITGAGKTDSKVRSSRVSNPKREEGRFLFRIVLTEG